MAADTATMIPEVSAMFFIPLAILSATASGAITLNVVIVDMASAGMDFFRREWNCDIVFVEQKMSHTKSALSETRPTDIVIPERVEMSSGILSAESIAMQKSRFRHRNALASAVIFSYENVRKTIAIPKRSDWRRAAKIFESIAICSLPLS